MLKITKLIGLGETLAALARRRGGGGGLRRGIAGIGDRGRSFAQAAESGSIFDLVYSEAPFAFCSDLF